jgi:DNA-binding response OmpR family regulator
MPDLNGLELYKRLREVDKSTNAMLLTAGHEQLYMSNDEELQQNLFNLH